MGIRRRAGTRGPAAAGRTGGRLVLSRADRGSGERRARLERPMRRARLRGSSGHATSRRRQIDEHRVPDAPANCSPVRMALCLLRLQRWLRSDQLAFVQGPHGAATALALVAMEVVHRRAGVEAEGARPERLPREPRMNVHKPARMTLHGGLPPFLDSHPPPDPLTGCRPQPSPRSSACAASVGRVRGSRAHSADRS